MSRVNIVKLAVTLEDFCNGKSSLMDVDFCNDGPLDGLFEYCRSKHFCKSNGFIFPDENPETIKLVCLLWISLNAAFWRQRRSKRKG